MERNLVGYRFSPTGEEVINYYLKSKILDRPWLVNEAINEINICAYDPEFLPSLSKLESKDLTWYFFTPREYTASKKKKGTKRTTPSGFWKATGKDRIIRDKRGHGVEIGIKKTLVYHHGKAANGVGTPWVMHEYHTTSLPLNQRNYVICQVMYKGADGDSLYGNNSNALSHSTMVSDLNTFREINTAPQVEQPRQDHYLSVDDLANPLNEQDDTSLFNTDTLFNGNYCPYQQPQAPWDDDYIDNLPSFIGGNYDDVLRDLNITTQALRNDHRPKKALTGIIVDCSSDSDAESISATSYQETSSPDSFQSLSAQFHTSGDEIPSLRKDSCTDIKPPAETSINRKTRKAHLTRRMVPSKHEVNDGRSKAVNASVDKKKSSSSMVKTEKKGWFITEEAMDRGNRKKPRYIYLMNMIIGLILLVAVIGNITSLSLSVKT
ncbi:hypothetical protein Bca4012_040675 [Brassica carinata]|uniref:NAC domain-containing protein n=1 Tax=Brassica carinata TaxID=52824 RepID=A0A8X7UHI1_BRACI|nr:hypothetical protein Bca52824_061557 [Brassica carinata]